MPFLMCGDRVRAEDPNHCPYILGVALDRCADLLPCSHFHEIFHTVMNIKYFNRIFAFNENLSWNTNTFFQNFDFLFKENRKNGRDLIRNKSYLFPFGQNNWSPHPPHFLSILWDPLPSMYLNSRHPILVGRIHKVLAPWIRESQFLFVTRP